MKRVLTLLGICTLLVSCAGMNKSECLNANWELIGLQDGTIGRDLSYATRHQNDCSKHGSQVDMDAYRTGHAEGVRTFCRAENGFSQGRSGRSYSGICPEDLEDAFLTEYDTGWEFYLLDKDISETKSVINRHLNRIEELNREIDYLAELAIQLDISKERRDRIQDDMREMQYEILDLERLVGELQLYAEDKEYERDELARYYSR